MDQCNQCGNFQDLTRCDDCTVIFCSRCRAGHAAICKDLQARKERGDGQTVRRVNTLPEPKAPKPVPELHPVDDPKQEAVNAGVPKVESDPFDVIASLSGEGMEANEGPWLDYDTIAKDFNLVSEAPKNANVQSNSEPVLQAEQNPETQAGVEGSSGREDRLTVDPAFDGGHGSDASGDSDNGASAPEPEVGQ